MGGFFETCVDPPEAKIKEQEAPLEKIEIRSEEEKVQLEGNKIQPKEKDRRIREPELLLAAAQG